MALLPDILHNLSDPLAIRRFRLGACWLIDLELQVIDPEVSRIKIPVLVLLVHLASFLRVTLDFPEESCPLGGECALRIDIALVALDLSAVNGDCVVEAALAAFEVGPRDDSFDVARDCRVLVNKYTCLGTRGLEKSTHGVQEPPHGSPSTYQPFPALPQNVHTAAESPCGSWAQRSCSPSDRRS